MKTLIGICAFFPLLVGAQPLIKHDNTGVSTYSTMTYYLKLYSQSGGKLSPSFERTLEFVKKLEAKRSEFKTEKAFLHHVFVKTHQQLLASFESYSSFADLLDDGSYNCLTATALYGILFDHFKIRSRLIETDHHIFILCDTDKGRVLIETTDYDHGFIDSPAEIEKKLSAYQHHVVLPAGSKSVYQYSTPVMDTVNLTGILGLLHFNHAAKAYNQKNYNLAINHLHHASMLHNSMRMDEFGALLLTTISESRHMDPELKSQFSEKLLALQKRKFRTTN
jgi:hypothetical protein